MARTKRGVIDNLSGYTLIDPSGDPPATDYFEEQVVTGNPAYSSITIWGRGFISFGPPTEAQKAYVGALVAGSTLADFPGDWVSFGFSPTQSWGAIQILTNNTHADGVWVEGAQITSQGVSGQAWNIGGVSSSVVNPIFYWSDLVVTTGGPANDPMAGGAVSETLSGVGGNDQLSGGGGSDSLLGGDGNDVLIGGDGIDRLYGGAGDDRLDPGVDYAYFSAGLGIDPELRGRVDGGSGQDVLVLDYSASGESLILTASAILATPEVVGVEALAVTGSRYNDTITGGASADTLLGGGGFDVIRGGGGNDWLDAGAPTESSVGRIQDGGTTSATALSLDHLFTNGSISFSVLANASWVQFLDPSDGGYYSFTTVEPDTILDVSLSLYYFGDNQYYSFEVVGPNGAVPWSQGTSTILPTVGTYTVRSIVGSNNQWAPAQLDITLTLSTNLTYDLAGNMLYGGVGDDTYVVFASSDLTIENAAEGVDLVRSFVTHSLAANVENLTLDGSAAIDGTGNGLANLIAGNMGVNVIAGGSGVDTLTGGGGNDSFRDSAANLSGDTITDLNIGDRIVITNATIGGFTHSLNGSTLTFTGGSLTLTGGVTGNLVASAAAGGGVQLVVTNDVRNDFNGDGRSDILWRNVDGQMSNWLGQANGGFVQNNANAAAVVPTAWQIAGTGDFNGDGRDDILWRNTDGQLSNWLATASGGFTQNNANAAAVVSTAWQVVGTGDFNGDGRDDILWRNSDGTVSDWLANANGNGGFTANDVNAARFVPTSWTVVGTGDFNGDGRDDILWRNSNGQLSDWLGQANGGFVLNDANALTNVDTSWTVAGTGDFNGDGRDDILWRNSNGQLSNWLGQANGGFVNNGGVSGTNVPIAWSVVAIGDYNGDGRDDILWRNTDGTLSNWLGTATGGFTPNDANAATPVPTAWHVQPEAPFL